MKRTYFRYHHDLAKRFVKDYNLPINLVDIKYFEYMLDLFEKDYQSRTKWEKLWDVIDDKFDGSPNNFLVEFKNVRENMIQTVANSEAYKRFNSMDMSRFAVPDKPNVPDKNVYNGDNVGKKFLSIDLSKANFQAIKLTDKEVMLGADTWAEFAGNFTDLDYFKESKYIRQVVFGQLNPKRCITIEKNIINEVWKFYKEDAKYTNIVRMSNDEIVIELPDDIDEDFGLMKDEIEISVKEHMGVDVHVSIYQLGSFYLYNKTRQKERDIWFYRTDLETKAVELCCVPGQYSALAYKMFHKMPVEEADYHFKWEGLDCRIMDELDIVIN